LLVEFSSVVDALRCATEWQRGMAERNAAASDDNRIEFRIGVHQGDIVVEDDDIFDDIFGDEVNVAAQLEGLAEPGGICVSAHVQEDVAGRLDLTFDNIGSPGPAIDFEWRLGCAAPMPANFRSQNVSDRAPPGSSRDRHQPRP
jgi:class 3 adenylate cyclase